MNFFILNYIFPKRKFHIYALTKLKSLLGNWSVINIQVSLIFQC